MNAALEACSGALMSHNTYKDIVKNKGNIDYWYVSTYLRGVTGGYTSDREVVLCLSIRW